MKTKALLLLLVGILATTGSTCINDGFLVAVNLTIPGCFNIKEGPTLSWTITQPGQPVVVKLANQIDESYRDNIKSARYYDLRVKVTGTYTGSVSGICYVNNSPLLTFSGNWSDFVNGQSLLGNSQHVTVQTSGVVALVAALNQFRTDPDVVITLSSSGSLSGQSPVPSGLAVCLEILSQVDAEVK
jgi:hypothetical protein